jgi:DNA-binding transcriptional LysR family regulator
MFGKWDWDDIRFFLATCREGSLSGAARVLEVDHVTVARRIALLEERLGAKLLGRTPEGFSVTAAGQSILRQCETMETAALNLERLVAGHDTRTAGSVRLTSTDALAYAVIVPCIVALRETHPELQIDLLPGVRALDIARREIDLAVRFSLSRPSGASLICRKLGAVGFALYASPQYLAARGTPTRGRGLRGHDVITYAGWPKGMGPRFTGESLDGARTTLRSNDRFVQLKATAVGLGISELACFLGDDCSELVRVWPEQAPMLRSVWLVMHEDLRRTARVRAVAAAVATAFEENAGFLRHGLRRARRRAPSEV